MPIQVDWATTNDRKIIDALDRVGWIFLPLPVNPGPDLDKLTEIDFRIEISGEILAVTARINIQNINSIDLIEIAFYRQGAVGVHHTRIKPGAQNGG